MFPDWFWKPESLFRTILWVISPLYVWLAGLLIRRLKSWHALQSESAARASLKSLCKALEQPPTLLESIGHMVCFIPIPIFSTAMALTLYLSPLAFRSSPRHPWPSSVHIVCCWGRTLFQTSYSYWPFAITLCLALCLFMVSGWLII